MTSLDEFARRLTKTLNEIEAEKTSHLVAGAWDEARAREFVGEIRAYRVVRDLIPELTKQTEERTSK